MDVDPGYCYNNNALNYQLSYNVNVLKTNAQWWYYFDVINGVCTKFLYYGCSVGNGNRFYSLYQCRSVCANRLTPQIGKFIIFFRYKIFFFRM